MEVEGDFEIDEQSGEMMKPARMKITVRSAEMLRPQANRRRRRGFNTGAVVDLFRTSNPPPPPLPLIQIDEDGSGCDEAMRLAVVDVQRLLGYTFHNPGLLEEALTHSSYSDHPSYQRLEHVGDAALTLAFTNYFFLTNPDLGPGPLSALRSANISTEKLARVAVRHGLYCFLRRNSPKLDQMVEEFASAVMREREEELGGFPYGGSTLKAPKVLADIVESIAAAVYVDCGFNLEMLWKVFRGLLEPIITSETLDQQPVTTLHEFCQKHRKTLHFKNWKSGNVNITNVFVDNKLVGVASSEQKMIAKLNAAREAFLKLSSSEPTDMDSTSQATEIDEVEGSKQKLNDICTKKHWPAPVYKIKKELGPAHDKRFVCSVRVGTPASTFVTVSEPKPRVKDAENSAASKMLSQVQLNTGC